MNETPDSLESELASLSPHGVSPELRRRIAERLAESTITKPPKLRWQALVLTGGLAAACVAAAIIWWGNGDIDSQREIVVSPGVLPVEPAPRVGPVAPAATVDWEPRLLTYQHALARSPEELDVVLSREARIATDRPGQIVQFRAFTPSNASLNAFFGDN